MASLRSSPLSLTALAFALTLSACGGGGSSSNSAVTPSTPTVPSTLPQEPGAPTMTGNTAIDGLNWFNYRRSQLGLSVLSRNAQLDTAAQSHSDYLRINNIVSHNEEAGKPGFTGVDAQQRIEAAGYVLVKSYTHGEVISATSNSSGFFQAEELIAAIYHRFTIFEPLFRDIGTGAATNASGYTYFTANLAATQGFGPGLGSGKVIGYPFNNQTRVPVSFLSDNEVPDPAPDPGQNEVGYPISVHADITAILNVGSFTVRPRSTGVPLTVRLLSKTTDINVTSSSVAAIVPLTALKANTVYDVAFSGTVDNVPVTLNWSFTTK